MAPNPLQELPSHGQSPWCDELSREMLEEREIDRMIQEWSLRGVTSNPTIFDKAISSGTSYDGSIERLRTQVASAAELFEELMIEDIRETADRFRPLYESSGGDHGFVSIEVTPTLAYDTDATIEEALRLHSKLDRPNIMVKVPGTKEGLPAIYSLLKQGVNINITLLFSVDRYIQVAETYCRAIKDRLAENQPIDRVRSVASFFVSRVDAKVDKRLDERTAALKEQENLGRAKYALSLHGKFGIANSRKAYQEFKQIFLAEPFAELAGRGAALQRPLWASMSVKSEKYRDVMYVEELIGPHTVSTMPRATLEAFADHGRAVGRLENALEQAAALPNELQQLGIDLDQVFQELEEEGVQKFTDSYNSVIAHLEEQL